MLHGNMTSYKKIGAVFILVAVIFAMCLPTFAFAAPSTSSSDVVIKKETFTTTKKPFSYNAYSNTIIENGKRYNFDSISYTEVSHSNGEVRKKSFSDLKSKSVPSTQTFTINGKSKVLKLSGTSSYKESKPSKLVTTRDYNGVVPGTESSVIRNSVSETATRNGKSVTIHLSKSGQTYDSSVKSFAYDKTMSSGESKSVGGISLTEPIQNQSGYKSKLKNLYDLPSNYKISSAYFRSDLFEDDGTYYRDVHFQGTAELRDYKVTYEEPSSSVNRYTTYSTTATYSDNSVVYKVQANIKYKLADSEDSNTTTTKKNNDKTEKESKKDSSAKDDGVPETVLTGKQKPADTTQDTTSPQPVEKIIEKSKANPILIGLSIIAIASLLGVLAIVNRKKLKTFGQNFIVKPSKKLVRKIRIMKHNMKK